ncbi:MAG: bi-domain-containing oxidoreductase [Gammaproteobacteria bacterium]|nr:bi-domain-containing oxidoreductase [Gammaproteobacteria bacterium]
MKQLLQNYRTGELVLAEVSPPSCGDRGVLVRTRHSVVSAGTERAMLALAKKGLLGKARARPDLVKQVLKRARVEGIAPTLRKALARLDEPVSLGYSAAGEVVEAGAESEGFRPGDRVAIAGAGYANHAEFNFVPRNLCVKVPDGVASADAAFATVGAIALQGIRQAQPQLGERVAVIGLGLIGVLTLQLLRANGCSVLGIDVAQERVDFAGGMGFEAVLASETEAASEAFTGGRGADAVIVTAATASNEPVVAAGEISRLKGRVVVVGLVGMEVPRETYYRKELDLRLSMSYGPGRYDAEYEERGHDYPLAYVRFTEQRNMESFLDLVRQGTVTPARLVSHRFAFADALAAYALVESAERDHLGILLEYPSDAPMRAAVPAPVVAADDSDVVRIAAIGAGAFARGVLLPHLVKDSNVRLVAVSARTGQSAQQAAARFKIASATTDNRQLLERADVDAVVVATRHGDHANLVTAALRAGKHVFVEKPLCIVERDLDELQVVVAEAGAETPCLMVGFNRRFSRHTQALKAAFEDRRGPMVVSYRVNAGTVGRDHWTHDPDEGGGRVIGEVCHFVDFCTALVDREPVSVSASGVAKDGVEDDSVVVTVEYVDGSLATIQYVASGNRDLAKERCEVFADGRSAVMEDFAVTRFYGGGRTIRGRQDKGFGAELARFVAACRGGGPWPIPWGQIVSTHRVCFAALRSLTGGKPVRLDA